LPDNFKQEKIFYLQKFEREAEKIYEDAHMALCERNKNQLHKLITEQAYAVINFQNVNVQDVLHLII
jgi:hypothetical protein